MEDDAATVALRAEEAFEAVLDAELGGEQLLGDGAEGPGADLDRDLARCAELDDLAIRASGSNRTPEGRRG